MLKNSLKRQTIHTVLKIGLSLLVVLFSGRLQNAKDLKTRTTAQKNIEREKSQTLDRALGYTQVILPRQKLTAYNLHLFCP